MKFQKINNRKLIIELLPLLEQIGYQEIKNPYTGGDNDYIIIDTETKRYSWFEGDCFPAWVDMSEIDDSKTLTDIHGMRFME